MGPGWVRGWVRGRACQKTKNRSFIQREFRKAWQALACRSRMATSPTSGTSFIRTPSDGMGSHTVSRIARTLTFSRLPKAEQAAYAKVFPKTHQEKMYVELAPAEIVSGPYSSIAKGSSLPAEFNAGKMTEIVLMRDWNRVFAPACTIIEIVLAFHAKHLMRGVVQRTRGYVYASDLLNTKGELKDAKCPASPFPSVADWAPWACPFQPSLRAASQQKIFAPSAAVMGSTPGASGSGCSMV